MNLLAALRFYFPGHAFGRQVKPVVTAQLWQTAQRIQQSIQHTRPPHSLGLGLIMRYMEWDVALYRAALEEGMPRTEAGQLIETINWQIFGPPIELGFKLSRLRSAKALVRARWLTNLMFKVMFTKPFARTVHPTSSAVAFDVTVCPLANYFKQQGVPELTRHAACSLDHQMAAQWGLQLQRAQTIAQAHPLCDFRFVPPKTPQ
ncbi:MULTISPECIES: L-2-amino-thiazoline-4-carboxylic acid hydrolase [unclassified Limnobacter]|jgi:hypothetical protein|uniref:L-2-amino-thiazoline-4-carboxylic acid hydrolase n=1 Tax=unclassified Limnobacter TaxID=2630203 RepID=UPI000C45245F|nr:MULTISPECIES: L-2-amino-thiazoline-4-carboxylic acid hydrolase [unclassified Limnobacter]MAG79751.1 hypothetical protein [Sutterellaceae bacterium]MDZ4051316.1 L-2-amino-thiazoline-4-carboxylic acid hydrolase [Limnobacter sp.]PZO14314.1 MAG: hypothetical protein DCE87_11190 [Betaproteobacteria bacterium]MBT83259.1 hypothetical protein [Sutterellaceae bacterium]PZO23607.1 MAG: hypothetical protein DCE89_09330 [Betaproteobacteria bacterium]|tara:strand:+ start:3873 stop:4484 length:612 start_codon:yes stop_codon:yes gene_type:complete